MSVIYQTRIEGNFEIKRVNLMKWFNSVIKLSLCFVFVVIVICCTFKPVMGFKNVSMQITL